MIKVENLTKKFGEVTAVKGLTFWVEEDEVFGFLGKKHFRRIGDF